MWIDIETSYCQVWIVGILDSDWFVSADKEKFVAPLSDYSLRGAGGAVSAHQPIGLYSIETTADQSPSENNGNVL